MAYDEKAAWQEAAFLAVHTGFGPDAILRMSHAERRQWVEAVASYLRRQAEALPKPPGMRRQR